GRVISRKLLGPSLLLGMLIIPGLMLPGCSDGTGTATGEPAGSSAAPMQGVPHELVFGAPGAANGLFVTPRGIAVDPRDDSIYVVDKTARIQHFTPEGEFINQWAMPESALGKPVGISVSPDGRVFVPDTHYHRILVFDSMGDELQRFGSFGTGPGQFVYPTDVVFGPDGELYIAEYGTNDRIQVFDSRGTYLREFGASGRGAGEFTRPQSMVFSQDRTELFIADSCNHRVVVVDPMGNWLRVLGGPGREHGRFCYPYGIDLLPDGTLLVCEYGSGRLQRLDPGTGAVLEVYGGPGIRKGRLREPWGVVAHGGRVLVLDSGNARVQVGALH
ncbi:MAG: 6-bladed beta-propeller, partial [Planctomycetota bacterium]|nr:6-bladed beta-propeller [Planctomycetota bacterium]